MLEFASQLDANGLGVSSGTTGLIADQALAIQAGHHAREGEVFIVDLAVDTDRHLAAPLQLSQEGAFRQTAA